MKKKQETEAARLLKKKQENEAVQALKVKQEAEAALALKVKQETEAAQALKVKQEAEAAQVLQENQKVEAAPVLQENQKAEAAPVLQEEKKEKEENDIKVEITSEQRNVSNINSNTLYVIDDSDNTHINSYTSSKNEHKQRLLHLLKSNDSDLSIDTDNKIALLERKEKKEKKETKSEIEKPVIKSRSYETGNVTVSNISDQYTYPSHGNGCGCFSQVNKHIPFQKNSNELSVGSKIAIGVSVSFTVIITTAVLLIVYLPK